MSRNLFRVVIIALVAAWLVSAAMFQVKETELAIKFRLRKIVATDFEPGLHFMVPWINTVQKFDRRVLTRNYPAEPFLTSEGKILNVDFYVKWRVSARSSRSSPRSAPSSSATSCSSPAAR